VNYLCDAQFPVDLLHVVLVVSALSLSLL